MDHYKIFSKGTMVSAIALSLTLAATTAQAALVDVGGVIWDPDWQDGSEQDLLGRHSFTQWFSPTSDPVASLDSFVDAIRIGNVLAGQDGTNNPSGFFLSGAGEFYQVNDPLRDTTTSSATGGGPDSFCPGCELTFAFGGLGLNKDNTFDISNAWAGVYVDHSPDFAIPPNTQAGADAALDGDLWAELEFSSLEFTAFGSGIASGFSAVEFNVIGGLAQAYFDPQQLNYNASAFFGSGPAAINQNARYSSGGNGSVQGNSIAIPEPSILALFGLGLLAVARIPMVRRKISA